MEYWTLNALEHDVGIKGRRVLVRADFNVPVDAKGNITDDKRIREVLPTLNYLLEHGAAQVIVMCHFGRPKGAPDPQYSTAGIARRLSELLGKPVAHVPDCIDVSLPEDKIVLLENLRFHAGEEKNDPAFAGKLASHADLMVDDAFGVSHRAHASNNAVKTLLPGAMGLLFEKEIVTMGKVLEQPKHPFIALLGGAKISTKIAMIEHLLPKVDAILLGGAMIFTFYRAMGLETGTSLVEPDFVGLAAQLRSNRKIVLPTDIVIAPKIAEGVETRIVSLDQMPKEWIGLDIGPVTLEHFKSILADAETIFWNGPMGYQELEAFEHGTRAVAEMLAGLRGATTIIGGGDSAAEIEKLGLQEKFT
ncbi:phosphoglycerate kinase, partial [Candidatus Woesearchaeota archaeon CG_4_10_14_0_8_um_filter_47_5]